MLIDVAKVVDAAQAGGRFSPARRAYWTREIAAGGRRGAKAITDLVMATPADEATRAAWARAAPRPVVIEARTKAETEADELEAQYRLLYPTAEQAAADSARIDRETGQAAQRFAEYERRFDNGMMATAAEPVTRGIAARARATGRQISDDEKTWTALFGRP